MGFMSGYRPRHAATETPPAGTPPVRGHGATSGPSRAVPPPTRGTKAEALPPPPVGPAPTSPRPSPAPAEPQRLRGVGPLGLVAAAIAVLAVVAVLLILSLPKSGHSTAASRALGTRAAGRGSTKLTQPGGSPGHSAPRVAKAKPAAQAKGATTASTSHASTGTEVTRPAANPAVATSTAENLPVPSGFGPLLRHVWVSASPGGASISAADVASTLPGSVYYAEQPAIAYYWAVSQFVPSASAEALGSTPAGKAVLAQFGAVAVFYKAPGRSWAYAGAYRPGTCSTLVPAPVYKVWGFCLSSQVGS